MGSDQASSFPPKAEPHLQLPHVFYAANQSEIETHAKAVFEEKRGAAAVQLPLGDDGDAVAQQVGLVHVMGGQKDGAAWTNATVTAGTCFPFITASFKCLRVFQ